ncbi:MAG: FtsX-like permease family protein [Eubacterium sp.]|nr:FtsX-like permease family protein [Eubacterium sp.]
MLLKLIKSNFKNDFSHMISFFLIMVLSSAMLFAGLSILLGYNGLHEKKVDLYNFADIAVIYLDNKDKVENYLENSLDLEVYEEAEMVECNIIFEKDGYKEDTKDAYSMTSISGYMAPFGEYGKIEAPHFTEILEEQCDNPIYISIYDNTNIIQKKLGDKISLKVFDKYYTFTIAGFYEGIISNADLVVFYIDPGFYRNLEFEYERKLEDLKQKLESNTLVDLEDSKVVETTEASEMSDQMPLQGGVYYVKIKTDADAQVVAGGLTKTFSDNNIRAYTINKDNIIKELTYMQNIIAAILSLFAIIITIISMIIIYFRITNSIEQNITNIGALKAIGYTSRQIRFAMILEFAITTIFSIVIGVILDLFIIPVLEQTMRSFSGIRWEYGFDFIAFIITLVLILGTVIVVALFSTRSIGKLDPVMALRFGVKNHSFKKNYAPIEKTSGPLTWIMSLKSILSNKKQNVTLFLMMFAIGFVCSLAMFLYYNVVYDVTHLYRMVNTVAADVELDISDKDALYELKDFQEIDDLWWVDKIEVNIEGYNVICQITDDWTHIKDVNIYEGRSPIYDNEVVIGGGLADLLDMEIGDEITVSYNGNEKTYLITGLEQGANNYGMDMVMSEEGAKHLNYQLSKTHISLYVKNHDYDMSLKLVEKVEDMYGDKLLYYMNALDALKFEGSITSMAKLIVGLLLIISMAVILLAMNLLVKTTIIKKQKEIGIKKAIGFSSGQIRMELLLSMFPQILIGATGGGIVGCLKSNDFMTLMLKSLGIMKSNMDIYPWMGLAAVCFIGIVSFVIIWILSGRIKYISAYSLITE